MTKKSRDRRVARRKEPKPNYDPRPPYTTDDFIQTGLRQYLDNRRKHPLTYDEVYASPTPESYDGKEYAKFHMDEVGQWEQQKDILTTEEFNEAGKVIAEYQEERLVEDLKSFGEGRVLNSLKGTNADLIPYYQALLKKSKTIR